MSKRIVFCADGTWDSSGKNTNVFQIFKALPTTATQFPFYDDGVGANGILIEKLLGGAFGTGLWQKIKNGYTQVAHLYEQGDDIFLFGFSRGAYTARSLAGMIAVAGLPTKNFDNDLVEQAFHAYRDRDDRAMVLSGLKDKYAMFDAKIRMVGVWDTVGSLGIPATIGQVDPVVYGFLDTGLHPDVLNAYQALAIDERRAEFPPTLWKPDPGNAANQNVEQVWFTGDHCDVGGSHPETGLADITLSWMLRKAMALGLEVTPDAAAHLGIAPDPKHALDQKHESWNILWGFPKRRSIAPDSSISNSVAVRCQHDSSYRPDNVSIKQGILAGSYKIVQAVGDPAAAAAAGAA
jgi:uncharacterized protein (DUF2235 family)